MIRKEHKKLNNVLMYAYFESIWAQDEPFDAAHIAEVFGVHPVSARRVLLKYRKEIQPYGTGTAGYYPHNFFEPRILKRDTKPEEFQRLVVILLNSDSQHDP